MRIGVRVARPLFVSPAVTPPVSATLALRCKFSVSVSCPEKERVLVEESANFLRWLRGKAGTDISSVLALGNSAYGRSLIALKEIKAGDCILKVPYLAQITSENLSSEIEQLLPRNIGNVSWVAIILLAEKELQQRSEWFTYLNCLPCMDEMHNAIFWSKDELKMICKSPVYQETIIQQAYIEKEFSALLPVLEMFPDVFGKVRLENFMHAYSLVSSRAWETSKGVSLIPFADFLNHDCKCGAILLSDVDKEISEVIADRDYAIGDQVMIRYGKFSNATLLLDFGFTLQHNIYDQVECPSSSKT